MAKLFSNEKFKFFVLIPLTHLLTYFLCGAVFMNLLNYEDQYLQLLGFRPMDEINALLLVLGQIVRGFLIGLVVWWIRDSIIGKKLAWLKLWAILVILGIISTYGPAPGSIEGIIYLALVDVPVNIVSSIFEVLLQPLLFSILVTFHRRKKLEIGRV